MKRLLLVVCLLLSSIASASDYLTVTGSGNTFEEARQQAFRKAIEFKVGATVLSDVETKNYQRVKDDIYIYSAGYVEDYKILRQESKNNNVILLMDVLVSESKLKNRILSEGKSDKDFDGSQHSAQITTFLQERQQGDLLLQKVLSNYPVKAYNIKQGPYTITIDNNRNPILNIPYVISWNFEFIKEMRETLDLLVNCKPTFTKLCTSGVVIMAKDPKDWILGTKTEHTFSDLNRIDQIHNRLVSHSPRIIARFYDINDRMLIGTCYTPRFIWGGNEGFYSNGQFNLIVIHGNVKESGVINSSVPLEVIDKTVRIQLSIEPVFVCN